MSPAAHHKKKTPGTPGRPMLSIQEAQDLSHSLYGLDCTARTLPSDRDQNFRLDTADGQTFVLKISNGDERRDVLEAQSSVLEILKKTGLRVPGVVPTHDGEMLPSLNHQETGTHLVRLLTWMDGTPLALARPQTHDMLFGLGEFLGRMNRELASFEHPGIDRSLVWDPIRTSETVGAHFDCLETTAERDLIRHFLGLFDQEVPPVVPGLPRQVIHGDANDYNVLVGDPDSVRRTISSLIDFGDLSRSIRISEVAIAAAYAMMNKSDPVGAVSSVAAGYHSVNPLSEAELGILFPLICGRLCICVCMYAFQKLQEPDNDYLSISQKPAWSLLNQLRGVNHRLAGFRIRAACGFEPYPGGQALRNWLDDHSDSFAPLMQPDPRTCSVRVFDFGVASTEWDPDALMTPGIAGPELFARMEASEASIGVGKYNEARLIYLGPRYESEASGRRTIHLGLDLFQTAGSPVFAPLAGTIHSVKDNDGEFDYGPTVILRHEPPDGPEFYTLYGHLSRSSIEGLQIGDHIDAGGCVGMLGAQEENGGWVPHVHFQIIGELLDFEGDFPGVASAKERAVWLSLCPDPNLIIGIPENAFPRDGQSLDDIREARRDHLGPSLSLSYNHPLHIVRGYMQYLYDADGRAYLDAVNNVPHVGHSHPVVVEAGQRQMATLNTNTRYLHENVVLYAERLAATMPDPLSVVYFVNSGSEANELALRIARAHTGADQTIVLDGAYHGNLSALIDISPYKHDGPGGTGAPSTTHVVLMPDPYRGPYKGPESGVRYAAHVQVAAREAMEAGGLSAFIAESLLGCGGQIVLPDGYLSAAFEHTRQAGGVCIVDEVQVGMGRVGSHFWGFQTQGVIPDIVIIGKPIGNGHPLGAVVTTAEIAASFDDGMEYFNTFGGNPVSCAIGMAVLDVIEKEQLQQRALAVGSHLMELLCILQDRHPIVGDVRGLGLFIGVELVRDRESLEPADEEATYVMNRMREEGILMSTDGSLHNVLKIKPPLVFGEADAERLAETLDDVLKEDFVTALRLV